jgi:hypothetical protein
VNRQAREWLDQIANRRLHSETRERPVDSGRSGPRRRPQRDSEHTFLHDGYQRTVPRCDRVR